MKSDKLQNFSKQLILDSVVRPSEAFGRLVLEVDHVRLGAEAKKFRRKNKVHAVRVADIMKVSKVTLSFLEHGKRYWTTEILRSYLRAVVRARRENEETKG